MNELKKAIRDKIGNTDAQKARVWEKMQQKHRKTLMPYFVSTAFLVCMIIFTAMLLKGNFGDSPSEQATGLPTSSDNLNSMGSSTDDTSTTIAIISSIHLEGKRISNTEDYVIHLYTSAEVYEEMVSILNIDAEPIDFSKHDVLLTQFISDGCGLVVNQLTLKEQQLIVKLNLPEELRFKEEVVCPTIAMPNTVLLVVPKLNITDGMFIEREVDMSFAIIEKTKAPNKLNVDENAVEITFTNSYDKVNFSFYDSMKVKQVIAIFKQAIKLPGIANMDSPEWQITFEAGTGETKNYFLWIDANTMTATLMDQEDTHTIYTLNTDMTVHLFDFMENNMASPNDSVSSGK